MVLSDIFNNKILISFIVIFILLILLLILVFKLILLYKSVFNSFSKLSYIIREDSKKYFASSSQKVAEIQSGFADQIKMLVRESLADIITDQQNIVSKVIIDAKKEADQMTEKAKKERDQIIEQAKKSGDEARSKIIENTTYIIEHVMADYIGSKFKLEDHEKVIEKSIDNYLKRDETN